VYWSGSPPGRTLLMSKSELPGTRRRTAFFPAFGKLMVFGWRSLRALRAGMAFRRSQRSDPPEELLRDTETLDGWKRISRLGQV
jgi:hypothetical protein